LEEISDLPAET